MNWESRLSSCLRRFWGVVLLAGLVPALATADEIPEELERNRQLLSKIRTDREHYDRLKQRSAAS